MKQLCANFGVYPPKLEELLYESGKPTGVIKCMNCPAHSNDGPGEFMFRCFEKNKNSIKRQILERHLKNFHFKSKATPNQAQEAEDKVTKFILLIFFYFEFTKENQPPSKMAKKRQLDKNQHVITSFGKRRLTEKGAKRLKKAAIDILSAKSLPLDTFESLVNFGRVFFEEGGGDGTKIGRIASSRRSLKREMEQQRETKFQDFKSIALDLARAGKSKHLIQNDFLSKIKT